MNQICTRSEFQTAGKFLSQFCQLFFHAGKNINHIFVSGVLPSKPKNVNLLIPESRVDFKPLRTFIPCELMAAQSMPDPIWAWKQRRRMTTTRRQFVSICNRRIGTSSQKVKHFMSNLPGLLTQTVLKQHQLWEMKGMTGSGRGEKRGLANYPFNFWRKSKREKSWRELALWCTYTKSKQHDVSKGNATRTGKQQISRRYIDLPSWNRVCFHIKYVHQ